MPVAGRPPSLFGRAGAFKGVSIPIPAGRLTLGRESAASGHLSFGKHSDVSRMHCSVRYDERLQCLCVVDLGSSNGTFLLPEGRRLPAREEAICKPGQLIRLGNDNVFEFQLGMRSAGRTPANEPRIAAQPAMSKGARRSVDPPRLFNWRTKKPVRKRIFICYRRDDTSGQAGRLYDSLNEFLGQEIAFMDVDAIPAGVKFDAYIDECLRDCFVCIVAIGQRWSVERLRGENDLVRKEIFAAISREIRIVPLLFDGAKMPIQTQLPVEIEEFALCQAYDFGTGRDFRGRVKDLLGEINRAIEEGKQREIDKSRDALRGIALRPHQYPLWVLFFCALIALSVIVSINSVVPQILTLNSSGGGVSR
ncbi:FHA domain-containing protein [Variovorax sp. J22R115]|uniref:FHA domain-containing protein n=1 Tax=Variovorax sp. J22R115 TaxID=3053509 RepID=UPI002578C807|nr:FHA domain-containing protein [Variovorax sp. J22R115]MDM0053809.1 FHA domain-containing protein [Variovorax sp. J22R115]